MGNGYKCYIVCIDKVGRLRQVSTGGANVDYVNSTHCTAHSDVIVRKKKIYINKVWYTWNF